jgi:protein-S-isoprenylcysteine O-methyltransferase Ste14
VAAPFAQYFKRVTYKTVPVYLAIAVLIVFARPELAWFLPGVFLVAAGEALRIWAAGHLMKTQEVTTTGPYAHVKNPLYLGTLLILVGFCLIASSTLLLIIGLAVFIIYYAPFKKKRESERLLNKFGSAWSEYDQAVPAYFPRFSPYSKRGSRQWSRDLFFENSEDGTLLAVLLGTAILLLRFLIRMV